MLEAILLPDLPRRTANFIVLGALLVVLLAPMAVRSVTSVAADRTEAMLPPAPISVESAPRGGLTGRQQAATVEMPGSDVELVITRALPTPAAAPMEALLYMKPTPRPAPAAPSRPSGPVDGSVWDRLAQCESSGNWSINTGNGYYGGLQFSYDTWLAYGGGEFAQYAHLATREQQIIVAERLHAKRGFQPWPACRIKLGLP